MGVIEEFEFEVLSSYAGERLDKFLSQHEKIISRSKAAELIEKNLVSCQAHTNIKASHKVKVGEVYRIKIPVPEQPSLKPLDLDLDIKFEDEDILIVNKPAGLVVHPALGHANDTLVNALVNHTDELSDDPMRPGIVHRLDKDTSGLLVVAKNEKSHNNLVEQFKSRTISREYVALVFGKPSKPSHTITTNIGRHESNRKKFGSLKRGGKEAITSYSVVESVHNEFSLLKITLGTGRTHQIRVHLSELGHPIIGDVLYGAENRIAKLKSTEKKSYLKQLSRFALHAYHLKLIHPKTHVAMTFFADWPSDLSQLANILGFKTISISENL